MEIPDEENVSEELMIENIKDEDLEDFGGPVYLQHAQSELVTSKTDSKEFVTGPAPFMDVVVEEHKEPKEAGARVETDGSCPFDAADDLQPEEVLMEFGEVESGKVADLVMRSSPEMK